MNLEFARRQMIDQQVRTWDVLDAEVLALMASIPRERFAPEGWRDAAFMDVELPLGHGERMLAPKVEGRILQAVAAQPDDAVLEVGTGAGYLTACLARQAGDVISIERHADLLDGARASLSAEQIDNVSLQHADASQAMPDKTFDVVVLGGSIAGSLAPFEAKLNPGGRLFAVTGSGPIMSAMLISRAADAGWRRESLFGT